MDPTKGFKDHKTGIFYEIVKTGNKEKVVEQNGFAFSKFLLSSLEIEVDIKVFNKRSNGITVGV